MLPTGTHGFDCYLYIKYVLSKWIHGKLSIKIYLWDIQKVNNIYYNQRQTYFELFKIDFKMWAVYN